MSEQDEIQVVATASNAVGELIKAAGDSDGAKEAGAEVGKTAVTLTKAVNNLLLPIAAVNFAFDRARLYFERRFKTDLEEVTKEIPPEHITEPRASLAGPVLQGIAFAVDEPTLKDLYIELLGTAMDARRIDEAHPAFVEVLKQITAFEAQTLQEILAWDRHTIVKVVLRAKDGSGMNLLQNYLIDWIVDEKPTEEPRLPALIHNWIRLGLIEVTYDRWLNDKSHYQWVDGRPELEKYRANCPADGFVATENGLLLVTDFGRLFAIATGIRPAEQPS